MEYIALNNGVTMPKVGCGVSQIDDRKQCEACVSDALEIGYRLIDTARAYENENAVGNAVKSSGIDRKDVFLTTKLWVSEYGYEKARSSICRSLEEMGTDYLDLVLLHQPYGDYYGAYRAMEELYKEGLIRAIGISNFSPERMVDMLTYNEIAPAVNQVETHLFYQQYKFHDTMVKYNVQHEAWGPLGGYKLKELLEHPFLASVAQKHNKTIPQIILRSLVQRGIVVIPKSMNREHMKENLDLFDFELDDLDMKKTLVFEDNNSLFKNYDDPERVLAIAGLK